MTHPDDTPARTAARDQRRQRDEGSALVLVLLLMVIGSLIVLPLMKYSMSVTRANTVLSSKTQRIEAVKSGLRVALAQPADLYDTCGAGGPSTPVTLAGMSANGVGVTTRCYFIDYQAAQSAEELRRGVVATQMGQTAPAELRGTTWAPTGTAPDEWWAETSTATETDKIWLPNLPTHGLNMRTPAGYQMPAEFGACTVYFPGTYADPLLIDGPTYFASGIYYFENTVEIVGGATVVLGQGATSGCTTDQDAAFYAVSAPSTHNINGLGATLVFGDEGKLVIDNDDGTVDVRFNARYVAPDDLAVAPSQGVSILSVNGEYDELLDTAGPLDFPDQMKVPLSLVGGGETPVSAIEQDYLPSRLTPKPSAPDAPAAPTASARSGAAIVAWTAPFDGGSPITGYTVVATNGSSCTTLGATTCAITGLTNGTPVRFTVIATNAFGDSVVSAESASVTPGGSTLTVPSKPARPTAVPYAGAARVTFAAPTTGGAPITGYTVTAVPGGAQCTVDMRTATAPPLRCDITGLNPALLTGYTFNVVATNAIGPSTVSDPSLLPTIVLLGLGNPPVDPPVTPTTYVPDPIVELELADNTAIAIQIPGYVSVPQGRFRVNNPHGLDVGITGGVLAAQFDIVDSRASGPQSLPIGFVETIVQRKFRIVSTTSAGQEASTAIVQVNQNGAYAINSWEVQ